MGKRDFLCFNVVSCSLRLLDIAPRCVGSWYHLLKPSSLLLEETLDEVLHDECMCVIIELYVKGILKLLAGPEKQCMVF